MNNQNDKTTSEAEHVAQKYPVKALIDQILHDIRYSEERAACANCCHYANGHCTVLPCYSIPVEPHGSCSFFRQGRPDGVSDSEVVIRLKFSKDLPLGRGLFYWRCDVRDGNPKYSWLVTVSDDSNGNLVCRSPLPGKSKRLRPIEHMGGEWAYIEDSDQE